MRFLFAKIFSIELIILFFSSNLIAQEKNIRFERISLEEGLSQSIVFSIIQDSKGFMWFGTEDGLNRYDGYRFTIFKPDPEDPNSISHNIITSIFEDHFGVIWIGTNGGGLNRYNQEEESFVTFQNIPNDPNSLSHNNVSTIYEDRLGNLWIGSLVGGLNRFNRETESFIHYQNNPSDPISLSSNTISSIYEDRFNYLWIGTGGGGLNRLVPSNSEGSEVTFIRYQNDSDDPNSLSSNNVTSIYEDRSGVLWIGTGGGGLNKLVPSDRVRSEVSFIRYQNDPNDPLSLSHNNVTAFFEDHLYSLWIGTNGGGLNQLVPSNSEGSEVTFIRYQHNPNNMNSIGSNNVLSIYEDLSGILWIGTYGIGISKYDRRKSRFVHYMSDPNDSNSLSNPIVWSIFEDHLGYLWVGTNGGGLDRFDREKNEVVHYRNNPENPNSLSFNTVRVIYEDKSGILWIGTDGGGLNKLIPKDSERSRASFIRYLNDPNDPSSLSNNFIRVIYEDRSGTLWIGTVNGGLNKLVPSDREGAEVTFTRYLNDPNDTNSLSNNQVRVIHEDSSGNLWIGTGNGGLNRFDPREEQFYSYQVNPGDPTSIISNAIHSIYEDRSGIFWIGTHTGGLNRFDPEKETFSDFRMKDGLPNDVVYSILEDDNGYLWLSTNNGLSRFNPQTLEFKNYKMKDGLQGDEFDFGAYHKSRSGELFFGGIYGFNAFFPDSIKDNPFIPPIIITDFQVFNKPVSLGLDSPLQKHISETEEITLSYRENVFSFEFAALSFSGSEKNQYKYKMVGFDEDWINSGTRKYVTYTNLDPGEYIFRVQGSNNDGVWNEEGTSVKLIITPPFWQTWWFRSIVTLTILLAAYSGYKRRVHHLQVKKKELEERVEERTRAAETLQNALNEVERLKNRLQAENIYLQDEIKLNHNFANILTKNEALKKILRSVEQVASTDATVLILGESGTGKELLARAIHNISNRCDRPLVKVDCAALPPNLIESELFGYEKGAFTGATSRKIGRFELADGGTIFLDEVGELPMEVQSKLLRILQDGQLEHLGSIKTITVNVRILAATNRNLEKEVKNGNFREDLYYRLNVFPITSPPLRERKEDIPLLVNHFTKKYAAKTGKKIESVPKNIFYTFQKYFWPGNIRELENIIERAVIVTPGKQLMVGDWLPKENSTSTISSSSISTLEDLEKQHIKKVLDKTGWRVSGEKGAAKVLGINPKTLDSRMRKLNIKRNRENP